MSCRADEILGLSISLNIHIYIYHAVPSKRNMLRQNAPKEYIDFAGDVLKGVANGLPK